MLACQKGKTNQVPEQSIQTPSGALPGFGLLNCGPHAAPGPPYRNSEKCPHRRTLCTYFNKKHYSNNCIYVNKIRLTYIATRVVLAVSRKRPQIVTAITKVAANINYTNFSWQTFLNVLSMTTVMQDRRNMSPYNRGATCACMMLLLYNYFNAQVAGQTETVVQWHGNRKHAY